MPSVVNTNLASLNAQRNLSNTQTMLGHSIQRLSTGLRVNSAKDDAAGLAIAERMNSQIRGMSVAIRNANDGISLAQTAEGALAKVGDMAQRMRELAVQSTNATNQASDRVSLNAEYAQLSAEITRTLAGTRFNGIAILGAGAGSMTFQVGANTAATDSIAAATTDLTAAASVTAVTGGDLLTAATSATAITNLDAMIDTVSGQRATYGATQNRFEAVIGSLQVGVENQTAARSRIMDADFAAETASLTRMQVLQQAGVAMLSQANAAPQAVLSLLRN
jgi:flagellin